MAWEAPMTWVAGNPVTSSDLNTQIRDNQLETAVGKADGPNQLLTTAGNSDVTMRAPINDVHNGHVTTTSTSATSLGGPSVTFDHNGSFMIYWACRIRVDPGTADGNVWAGPEIIGEATGATANRAAISQQNTSFCRFNGHIMAYGLPAQENTVELKYWVDDSATRGSYATRELIVIPF